MSSEQNNQKTSGEIANFSESYHWLPRELKNIITRSPLAENFEMSRLKDNDLQSQINSITTPSKEETADEVVEARGNFDTLRERTQWGGGVSHKILEMGRPEFQYEEIVGKTGNPKSESETSDDGEETSTFQHARTYEASNITAIINHKIIHAKKVAWTSSGPPEKSTIIWLCLNVNGELVETQSDPTSWDDTFPDRKTSIPLAVFIYLFDRDIYRSFVAIDPTQDLYGVWVGNHWMPNLFNLRSLVKFDYLFSAINIRFGRMPFFTDNMLAHQTFDGNPMPYFLNQVFIKDDSYTNTKMKSIDFSGATLFAGDIAETVQISDLEGCRLHNFQLDDAVKTFDVNRCNNIVLDISTHKKREGEAVVLRGYDGVVSKNITIIESAYPTLIYSQNHINSSNIQVIGVQKISRIYDQKTLSKPFEGPFTFPGPGTRVWSSQPWNYTGNIISNITLEKPMGWFITSISIVYGSGSAVSTSTIDLRSFSKKEIRSLDETGISCRREKHRGNTISEIIDVGKYLVNYLDMTYSVLFPLLREDFLANVYSTNIPFRLEYSVKASTSRPLPGNYSFVYSDITIPNHTKSVIYKMEKYVDGVALFDKYENEIVT